MIFCSYPFAQFSKHRSEIIEAITQMLENGKYILVAKNAIFERTHKILKNDFKYAIKKLDLFK